MVRGLDTEVQLRLMSDRRVAPTACCRGLTSSPVLRGRPEEGRDTGEFLSRPAGLMTILRSPVAG